MSNEGGAPSMVVPSSDRVVGTGGDRPYNDYMESRIARLEVVVDHIQRDVVELRGEVRELRRDIVAVRTTDFRLLFGAIIVVALGLASIMARGFGWL